MSEPTSHLPAHPSLEQLQKRAKDLLKQHRAGDGDMASREMATLADAQFVIASEYGFESWANLKRHIEALPVLRMHEYEQLATALAAAHITADSRALREVNRIYSTAFVADFHDPAMLQQRLPTWFASDSRTPELALKDARQMVAHAYGFENWESFSASVSKPVADPRSAPFFISSTPPFYRIDRKENRLTSEGTQSEKGWKAIFAVMKEFGITTLKAGGITDAAVKQLSRLDQLTHLSMTSNTLTDEGLQHLARMPQLLDLEIGGPQITDGGLNVLRHLSELRRFKSCWTRGISDIGAANLAFCHRLEHVNLMGTAAGDGLIRALAGTPNLRALYTGRGVSDAGIKFLHEIPAFKTWLGGKVQYGLMTTEGQPNHLLLDGPFTDSGLAGLVGLDGLFGLSFFWHSRAFTSAGLARLRSLPRLGLFGCHDTHCDDEAMRHIAAMPQLRLLMGQGAVATDVGWEALSRSQTIEYIWGCECPNLTGRGFAALSTMPALRGLGVSCKNVDDASLALLPRFPALREIMPMDVSDAGFRHVGRCEKLENLWCMYCRDTGDAATEQIAKLSQLKMYYAGMTRITDQSLEILGHMNALECMEFWACQAITEVGLARLAALPQLREITIGGSPHVSFSVAALFPKHVQVKYSA